MNKHTLRCMTVGAARPTTFRDGAALGWSLSVMDMKGNVLNRATTLLRMFVEAVDWVAPLLRLRWKEQQARGGHR